MRTKQILALVLAVCPVTAGQIADRAPVQAKSLSQAIDEFVASLPPTVTPVVSPTLEVVAGNTRTPSTWKEYRNDTLGFSFKYAPEFSPMTAASNSPVGVDCSSWNTVCLTLRREGGKEESFSVETMFSVTAAGGVSPRSCLSPPDAFRNVPFDGSVAQNLAQLGGVVFRKSDCGGAGLGTGIDCRRYDVFANQKCYEIIPQLTAGCGGAEGKDLEACGAEVGVQARLLKATLATFTFTKPVAAVDPRSPIPNEIAYAMPARYKRGTIEHGDIDVTFEYPDDPKWELVDDEFQHGLAGMIPDGGAQVSRRSFVAITFDPMVMGSAKHFVEGSRFGLGWALNGDYRYATAPKAAWRISAGLEVSGYFVLEYATTGRVDGRIALDVGSCHTAICTAVPPHMLVFEFLDLDNEIARRFVSSLQIGFEGNSSGIKLGERLNPGTSPER
jgi:hypothetical protein